MIRSHVSLPQLIKFITVQIFTQKHSLLTSFNLHSSLSFTLDLFFFISILSWLSREVDHTWFCWNSKMFFIPLSLKFPWKFLSRLIIFFFSNNTILTIISCTLFFLLSFIYFFYLIYFVDMRAICTPLKLIYMISFKLLFPHMWEILIKSAIRIF